MAKERVLEVDTSFQNGGDGRLSVRDIVVAMVLVLVVAATIATVALFVLAPSLTLM